MGGSAAGAAAARVLQACRAACRASARTNSKREEEAAARASPCPSEQACSPATGAVATGGSLEWARGRHMRARKKRLGVRNQPANKVNA